ncbi:MAG TPA: hypothetical protein VLF39_03850 [Candidatus Saccharimonadales bacterium]|nr:hypothetical protein [Candidatus Saccharimonadales bacterium]
MNSKYFGVALGIVVLACVAVAVIVSHPGGKSTKKTTAKNKVISLLDYQDKDASVSVTTLGPIVGDEKRRAINMTISADDRSMSVLDGYNQTVEKEKHYKNNQTAFTYFIRALNGTGFTLKRPSAITDYRGVCAGGNIYIYQLYDDTGQLVSDTWSTSCDAAIGPFAGSGPAVRELMQMQLTDYADFTGGVFDQ